MDKSCRKEERTGIAWLVILFVSFSVCFSEEEPTFARLKELWVKNGHNLSRAFSDDHIEFYDELRNESINAGSTFSIFSDLWSKAKMLYNSTNFGNDSRLYVIIHKECNDSDKETTLYMAQKFLNVIYCNENDQIRNITFDCHKKMLIEKLVDVVVRNMDSSEYFPNSVVSDWLISHIIWFSITTALGFEELEVEELFDLTKHTIRNPGDFPQNDYLFRDWYRPIFTKYGGTTVVDNFLDLIKRLTQQDKSLRNRRISPGEFVHIWSMAVKDDLRLLANEAFGWTTKYKEQFRMARSKFSFHNYPETFYNISTFSPPLGCNSFPNLRRDANTMSKIVHQDHQVVFCSDRELRNKITLLSSKGLDEAWNYVKKTFGPLGADPYLYVSVTYLEREDEDVCVSYRLGSYLSQDEHNNDIIHLMGILCLEKDSETPPISTQNSYDSRSRYVFGLGMLVFQTLKDTGKWPMPEISVDDVVSILTYDILVFLGQTETANRYASWYFVEAIKASSGVDLWSFPIYTHFKGVPALTSFQQHVITHWPKQGTDLLNAMNVGEFVHFWSMAVNTDLRDFAEKVFAWNVTHEKQFEKARAKFPDFNYTDTYVNGSAFPLPMTLKENWLGHRKQLTLEMEGNDVGIFRENNASKFSMNIFQTLCDAWSYAKQTYGPFFTDPNLYVILHKTKHEGCFTSSPRNSFNWRSVVDCGLNPGLSWGSEIPVIQDLLVEGIAKFIQESVTWKLLTYNNYSWKLTDILVYDIYTGLQRANDSERWMKNKFSESTSQNPKLIFRNEPKAIFQTDTRKNSAVVEHGKDVQSMTRIKTNWFKDWYFPIYSKYGGTKVVQKFHQIMKENLQEESESEFTEGMSVGEFVHFWSGAVGMDLESFATKTFEFSPRFKRSIKRAKRRFSKITYSGTDEETKTKPKTSQGQSGNPNSNTNTIIGISVPVGLIICVLIVTLYLRQQRQINILKAENRKLTQRELKDFYEGASRVDGAEGYALIQSEPFNKEFEISRNALDLDSERILGSGEYGLVLKGTLKLNAAPGEAEQVVAVAVKTPKPDVDVTTFKALLSELKVMGHIGTHENIIQLMGAVTVRIERRELLVALEFCAKGDLLNYMRRNREDFTDLLVKRSDSEPGCSRSFAIEMQPIPSTSKNYENTNNEFTALNLLEWSRQIANGMNFIGSKNVIHGDLAARNILLTAGSIAKISDFGLSRQLVNYTNYTKKSEETPMPWRWMAIESLLEMKFSAQSDVWAFGVTLFEIFSLGSIPYPGGNWTHEFVEHLSGGYRLSSPRFGNDEIYELMMGCMRKEPSERLSFPAITIKLQNLKTKLFPESSAERANCIYVDIQPQDV